MKNRISGLRSKFRDVVIAGTISSTFVGAMINTFAHADENQKPKPDTPYVLKGNDTEYTSLKWDQFIDTHSAPYEYVFESDTASQQDESQPLKKTWKDAKDPNSIIAAHIESGHRRRNILELLHFDQNRGFDTSDLILRHGEAAAYILNKYSDLYAGEDMDVHFLEHKDPYPMMRIDMDHPFAHKTALNLDVITLSTIATDGEFQRSTIDTIDEIESARALWDKSNTILVWAAGNEGSGTNDLERQSSLYFDLCDSLVRVGEAREINGTPFVMPHSSRIGVSFVVLNPYMHGEIYPYICDEEGLRKTINDIYKTQIFGLPIRQHIENMIISIGQNPQEVHTQQNILLRGCHPDFDNASFPGKEYLLKDKKWQAEHPDKVIDAYVEGLVASIEYYKEIEFAGKNGFLTGMKGSSNSGPHAGSFFTALRHTYPDLTEYDLIAASILASRPVGMAGSDIRVHYSKDERFFEYHNNGCGLPYNQYQSGFGLLDYKSARKMADTLSRLIENNPDLQTQKTDVSTGYVSFDRASEEQHKELEGTDLLPNLDELPASIPSELITSLGQTINNLVHKKYTIEMTENAVAMRTQLALKFKDGNVPSVITSVNPSGGKVDLSPSVVQPGGYYFSTCSAVGHFGNHTAGNWTIEFDGYYDIEQASITVYGYQIGGVIDTYIQDNINADGIMPSQLENHNSPPVRPKTFVPSP